MATEYLSKTRRQKRIFVPCRMVLEIFSNGLMKSVSQSEVIRLPEPLGLPDTARVLAVQMNFERNSFQMIVEDESFEEVHEGLTLPELPIRWITRELRLKDRELQQRDVEWVLAMTEALGSESGFVIPIQPEAELFKKLFNAVRISE